MAVANVQGTLQVESLVLHKDCRGENLGEPILGEPILGEPIFGEPIFAEPILAEPMALFQDGAVLVIVASTSFSMWAHVY